MPYSSFVTYFTILFFVSYIYAQQCDQPLKTARFNCYPEDNPTQGKCEARQCCWRPSVKSSNSTGIHDPDVPDCYYPLDFPFYEVMSNEPTNFGQQIKLYKLQQTYWNHDISNLTVDLIYETQQRFRIKIYDSFYSRYQVPLPVPIVTKKADVTDYAVDVISKPFGILVTRKSTNVIL
jgi:hypothetical protein